MGVMPVFRDACPEDVACVVALVERAYRGEVSRAGWTTEADLLDGQRTDAREIGELVHGQDSRVRLAFLDGELVACVRIDRGSGYGYIGMVSVEPTRQRDGLGRQLLAEAERVIQEDLGLNRARMTVIGQRVELIAWYARRGYQPTGEREPFPYGEPRNGLPRRPDLYFEVLEKQLR
ncbi:MAG: GNAT family N-acetyltransferase [Phycisphaerae bacterium]|nr:GNAT family N-acetyltransferase [Phycisphaerae bacterium]